MPSSSRPSAINVALVAVPQVSCAVVYGLHEVFRCVGTSWGQLTGEPNTPRTMKPRIVGSSTRSFRTSLGAPIAPDSTFADSARADIVIVADLNLVPGEGTVGMWPKATDWLRRQFDGGAIVCSACTGSLMLAEAALLDGLEATSHWSANSRFEESYPKVTLKSERLLLPAGDGHRIITGGGASAWNDLALYLIARFCGAEEARRIAKIFLLGDKGDGQLPFAHVARPAQHSDAVIQELQDWIADNYARPNPVAELEKRSGLAPRTMKRRFKTATGYVPIKYVQSVRIEAAKQLLESTDTSIEDIGDQVGYVDPKSFRSLFKKMTGIAPSDYRRRFQPIGLYVAEAESKALRR